LVLAAGLLLISSTPGLASEEGHESAAATFADFGRDFLDWHFETHPVQATSLGVHEHDSRLPDMSRSGFDQRIEALGAWLERLARIDRERLDGDAHLDYRILEYAIRAELLELSEIRSWERNPLLYNRTVANGVASLIDREFAPLEQRLPDLIARLDQVSRITASARHNLTDVPKLWAELALRGTQGTERYLDRDVPAALRAQGLDRLERGQIRRWERSRRRVLTQMRRFARWLEQDLLPRANGNFRLGRELFERKLLYEEHIATTVDELRALNQTAIRDYQAWVVRETARIDSQGDPANVMRLLTEDHPAPDELIPTARQFVQTAQRFVLDHELVTLPTERLPVVRPTPEYARTGFASMSTPGPFETVATEAYYNITNVDPGWAADQQRQHLTYFNYPGLLGISVHEVMPGHFVQLLFRQQLPTDVRKVFTPSSLVEGWAHYAEQMLVDEGLGDGAPEVRLGQLRRALQRHARWHVGLAMHAYGESVEQAAEEFQRIAYFAPFPALRETQRGTYNPTYLYYALGRMRIFGLRDDYKRHLEAQGKPFSLREFHDQLLRLGLPIPLAREVMIPSGGSGSNAD
jgi:uncharacterized protein (DUF885 family)